MGELGSPLTSGNIQYVFAFIIVVLAGVIAYQNRQLNKLNDKIGVIQDARLVDAKETVDKVSSPLSSISQTINLIYDKLRESKGRES